MKSIAVMGLGNFGTALARNWLAAGHDVRGWTVEEEVYESIRSSGVNEKYLNDVSLAGINVSMDIAGTMAGAEVIVLALPSGVVLDVVDEVVPHLRSDQVLLDLLQLQLAAVHLANQLSCPCPYASYGQLVAGLHQLP